MQLADFTYTLPPRLIAQEPVTPRDHSRLLLLNRQTGSITHHHFYDLPALLPPKLHLVANNTKVFPARLLGNKVTGGKVEVLLLKKMPHHCYQVIVSPGLSLGQTLTFTSTLSATVTAISERIYTLQFSLSDPQLTEVLAKIGIMPTPPYIKKMLANKSDYQTVYAKYGFSAAAPTAGLHFTPTLLSQIKQQHPWHELTLDVGLGTFLPVKETDISKHHMHSEHFRISPSLATTLATRPPTLAVGTTTLRALESSIQAGSHETEIFIYPPYQFKHVDALLTNFHLPGSTLLMLVSAFCSYPNTLSPFTTFADSILGHAYAEAIRLNYRFFSFGDAMLIL